MICNMNKFILSIDQGTTSSRVVIYDKNFIVIDSLQKDVDQFFPKDGWVEHDAYSIWKDVKKLIKDAMKTSGVIVTYSSSGKLKKILKELKFEIEILQGPKGKKEMTRATK